MEHEKQNQMAKVEYINSLLGARASDLSEHQAELVDEIKRHQSRIELYQIRLMQMIQEAQGIQRSITEAKGSMTGLGDVLWKMEQKRTQTDGGDK